MKIIVLMKEVPDTYGDRKLALETGLADREASSKVLDEIGERGLEVALTYADANAGTHVTVVSMCPESASVSLRKTALAMGANDALQVVDPELLGADLTLTAEVLAAAIRRAGFDLVIVGNQSTDGSGGVMASMIAELLEVPAATALTTVSLTDATVSGTRVIDGATQQIEAALPALISITEALPDPRFANFKGIMAAKKKPFETVSLADLGVSADPAVAPRSIVIEAGEKPARAAGVKITDEGDAGTKLAEFLVQNRLV